MYLNSNSAGFEKTEKSTQMNSSVAVTPEEKSIVIDPNYEHCLKKNSRKAWHLPLIERDSSKKFLHLNSSRSLSIEKSQKESKSKGKPQ